MIFLSLERRVQLCSFSWIRSESPGACFGEVDRSTSRCGGTYSFCNCCSHRIKRMEIYCQHFPEHCCYNIFSKLCKSCTKVIQRSDSLSVKFAVSEQIFNIIFKTVNHPVI